MGPARLYEAAGKEKYSDPSKFSLDPRGIQPYYVDRMAGCGAVRGQAPACAGCRYGSKWAFPCSLEIDDYFLKGMTAYGKNSARH